MLKDIMFKDKDESKEFTKKDLVPGKHIVVTEDGDEHILLTGGVLWVIDGSSGWEELECYDENFNTVDDAASPIINIYSLNKVGICFDIQEERYRTLVWERKPEKKEWYEDIPEGGVLCKVWDYGEECPELATITKHTKGKYPYTTEDDTGWMNATPLTKEEVGVFLNNVPKE